MTAYMSAGSSAARMDAVTAERWAGKMADLTVASLVVATADLLVGRTDATMVAC